MSKNCNLPHILDQVVVDLESKLVDKINSPSIINCLYLVAASMISYYGEKHKFSVYNSILNTGYVIDDYSDFKITHTIRDVLSKSVCEYKCNDVMSVCNINGNDLSDFEAYYTLFITNRSVSTLDILEGLIREINKIFLSKNNTFTSYDNDVLLRNGISDTNLSKSKQENRCETINDVITYLQIEDILKEIKKLNYTGNNDDLNKLLNDIKEYDMDNIILDCCLPLVNLFRPLFDLDYVKNLLNINMYEGTIDNIKDEFDSVLGLGSFDRMSIKLDKLYYDFYHGHLDGNTNEYLISKDYVAIRDNFINKYIKKKYA